MFKILSEDLTAFASRNGLAVKLKIILLSHAFHLVFFCRLGQFLSKFPMLGSLFRILFEYFIRIVFSSDISLKARIGPGLVIVHGHDIVIGGEVVIGSRCKILNGVTLGNKDTESGSNQQPIVGDDVVIGTGAKILGHVIVGNNVVIGANSVVLTDIPSDHTFAGIPAKDIHKK